MASNSISLRPFSERRADCCVFVLNISYEVTEEELKKLFTEEVADVTYIEFFKDEKGMPNGIAVIEFPFKRFVKRAIEEMHRKAIKGRSIVVKSTEDAKKSGDFDFYIKTDEEQATPKTDKHKGENLYKKTINSSGNSVRKHSNSHGHSTRSFSNGGNLLEGSLNKDVNYFNRAGNSFGGTVNRNSFGGTVNRNCFGGSINRSSFGGSINRSSFGESVNRTGSNLINSLISGRNPLEFSLSGQNFSGGSFERGDYTQGLSNSESFLKNPLSVSDGAVSQWKHGNTYGLPVQYLNALEIDAPIGRRVYVSYLDQKVTEDDLRETFQLAGTIISVEIIKNESGQSRGIATVEYEHPLQAVQAISMLNKQMYFNRWIHVRMDKFNDFITRVGTSRLPKGLKTIGCGLGAEGKAVKDVTDLEQILQKRIKDTYSSDMNYIERQGNFPSHIFGNTGIKNLGVMGGYNMGGNFKSGILGDYKGNFKPGILGDYNMEGNYAQGGMGGYNMGGNFAQGGMGGYNMRGNFAQGGMGGYSMEENFSQAGMGRNYPQQLQGMETERERRSFNKSSGLGIMSGHSNKSENIKNTKIQDVEKPESLESMDDGDDDDDEDTDDDDTDSSSDKEGAIKIDNLPPNFSRDELNILLKRLCSKYGDVKLAEIQRHGIGHVTFSSKADARRAAGMLDERIFYGQRLNIIVVEDP